MKQVEAGALVEVAYTLRAQGPEGEELETCTEENPFVFRVGQDEALEAFEQGLMGKREGEPFILHIDCDDAYGEETDDAIVALPKETFVVDGKLDKEIMKPGEVVPLEDEDGNEADDEELRPLARSTDLRGLVGHPGSSSPLPSGTA